MPHPSSSPPLPSCLQLLPADIRAGERHHPDSHLLASHHQPLGSCHRGGGGQPGKRFRTAACAVQRRSWGCTAAVSRPRGSVPAHLPGVSPLFLPAVVLRHSRCGGRAGGRGAHPAHRLHSGVLRRLRVCRRLPRLVGSPACPAAGVRVAATCLAAGTAGALPCQLTLAS